MAEQDDKLVGITPAMREGSGMVEFSERFPQQYFDVAIAEQHAVTLQLVLQLAVINLLWQFILYLLTTCL